MKPAKQQDPIATQLQQLIAVANTLPRTEQLADLQLCCQLLEQGVQKYPQSIELIHHLAETYRLLNQHDKALELYKRVVTRLPTDEMYFGLGLAEMFTSNLTSGFDAYKHRFQLPGFKKDTPACPWQEWQGESLKGKKLYVWAEQGVGDIFMWAGMLPWLVSQGADVTCAVPAKLLSLFRRSFPAMHIVEKILQPGGTFDYNCPMGNLMALVLPHYKPAEHPAVLKADKDAVVKKRAEYFANNPKAKKLIGLSWHTQAAAGWRRNIPLELWEPLLNDPDALYVSLQYNQRLDDVDGFNKRHAQPMVSDYSFLAIDDVDSWATQHAAMDHVFSIQNSSAHLAGALGVPATLFLSAHGAFHWGDGSTKNIWYGSVDVCRRKPGQSWEDVIREARR